MDSQPQEAGELLTLLMRRRGWSAPKVASLTGGSVSPSAVRAYMADLHRPRPEAARAVAAAFGPEHVVSLLNLWEYPEMAEQVASEQVTQLDMVTGTSATAPVPLAPMAVEASINMLEYSGTPLTAEGQAVASALITWLQQMEAH